MRGYRLGADVRRGFSYRELTPACKETDTAFKA